MDPQRSRSLRDISPVRVHRRDDVLTFERLYSLLECDSIPDQFMNDLAETIVNTRHEYLNCDSGRTSVYYAVRPEWERVFTTSIRFGVELFRR